MSPICIIVLVVIASPFVAYFVVKFGAYGYFRAKSIASRKEVQTTVKDN